MTSDGRGTSSMRDRAVLGKSDTIYRLERLELYASNNDSDDTHDNTFILLSSIFLLTYTVERCR